MLFFPTKISQLVFIPPAVSLARSVLILQDPRERGGKL
jgi:hypothetical protein